MHPVLASAANEIAQSATNAAWFTGWVTLGAAVIAVITLLLLARQVRDSGAENERNIEAQTRPYVGIEFSAGVAGAPSMDIVIQNTGRATAANIRVEIEGGFAAQSENDEIGPALGRLFATPFTLAPQGRRRVFWRLPDDERSDPRGDFGAPLSGVVSVSYEWQRGDGKTVRYAEPFPYDLAEYPKLMPAPRTGPERKGTTIDATAVNVVHTLRAIAEHLAELRR